MANARDLNALKNSLSAALELSKSYEAHESLLFPLHAKDYLQELVQMIQKTIVPEPPLAITEGDIINPNYSAEMVELSDASRGATEWINRYEIELRNQSGLSKLKIGYTNAFGFYIEVSKAASQNVPDTFIRKQTLVNAERYTTPELKTKEAEILTAGERRRKKEHEIFCELRDKIKSNTEILKTLATQVAFLDVMAGLAVVALKNRYICPQIIEGPTVLNIEGGRHPVVETREKQFVPNDLSMQDNAFILLTGPNMAGKSTYMRQNALIVLMAQVGSFVPVSAMQWSLIDRIFTRVGASDDIASGHSTFMVEMIETASILNLASQNSLIILDEVGRGTSTFDGVSIAWSVSEYLIKKIKAKVIFATHYQELTKLAELYPEVKNYSLAIKEEVREGKKQIVFLRKVINQPCDKSYGVHVAALAGLPNEVVKRAEEILEKLIQDNDQIQLKLF
jgi:DNA mismatch repair protein MutS